MDQFIKILQINLIWIVGLSIHLHAQYIHPFHENSQGSSINESIFAEYSIQPKPSNHFIDLGIQSLNHSWNVLKSNHSQIEKPLFGWDDDGLSNLLDSLHAGDFPVQLSQSNITPNNAAPRESSHSPKIETEFISQIDEFLSSLFQSNYDSMLVYQPIDTPRYFPESFDLNRKIDPTLYVQHSLDPQNLNDFEQASGDVGINQDRTYYFTVHDLQKKYPDYTNLRTHRIQSSYDIFEGKLSNPVISNDTGNEPLNLTRSNRQRRLAYSYEWEMADFYSSGANDDWNLTGFLSSDTLTIRIKPILGGVNRDGNGSDVNSSATEGLNTPKYLLDGQAYSYDSGTGVQTGIDPGIWTDNVPGEDWDREWSLMRITGEQPTVIIDDSAIKYYMNWHYGSFDTGGTGPEYKLLYYSAVPEPSTYFMTAILFCFVGLNKQSWRISRSLFAKLFNRREAERNCSNLDNQVS